MTEREDQSAAGRRSSLTDVALTSPCPFRPATPTDTRGWSPPIDGTPARAPHLEAVGSIASGPARRSRCVRGQRARSAGETSRRFYRGHSVMYTAAR